jgi:hypothetical protein
VTSHFFFEYSWVLGFMEDLRPDSSNTVQNSKAESVTGVLEPG